MLTSYGVVAERVITTFPGVPETADISIQSQLSAAKAESLNEVVVVPSISATWSDESKLVPAEPIVALSSMLNVTEVAAVT
jgi:hypothetical protein